MFNIKVFTLWKIKRQRRELDDGDGTAVVCSSLKGESSTQSMLMLSQPE